MCRNQHQPCRLGICTVLLLAACAGLVGLGTHRAQAQGTGSGLVVDVDSAISLSCDDRVSVKVTAGEVAQTLVGSGTGDQGISSPATSTSLVGSGSDWNVTITGLQTDVRGWRLTKQAYDICTVRALTLQVGNYTVSTALTSNTWLDGPAGSRVRVTRVHTRPGYSNGRFAPQFGVNWRALWFNLGGRFTVDVELEFDIEQASRPGLHTSGTAGTFTVTAVAP